MEIILHVCLGGFSYQSLQFFNLYWTYPTVVDIQDVSPTYLEIPAFSFCNPIGYDYRVICDYITEEGDPLGACFPSNVNRYMGGIICKAHKAVCINGTKVPDDFQLVTFGKFATGAKVKVEGRDVLRQPLEDYLSCTIEFAGTKQECNLTNVMGSFYSKEELPQFCYTIYSLWGEPGKKRELIPQGSVMKFHFVLNTTLRPAPDMPSEDYVYLPRYNLPDSPSVQMAIHSPYFLTNPYSDGHNYIAGKAYEVRVTMREKHLLPKPYQTKCTDYMKIWEERGGRAPINQMGIVQECRMNKTYEMRGCVPANLDYPHMYDICPVCTKNCTDDHATHECLLLADSFTQSCDSVYYTTVREDKSIRTFRKFGSAAFFRQKEVTRFKIKEYDCTGTKAWRPECGTIDVDVLFDRFEISNFTYKPKFESLEMFSVVGGYMGMWLGISLMTVYDFLGTLIGLIRSRVLKRRRNRKKVFPFKNKLDLYAKNCTGNLKLMSEDIKKMYY